MLRTCTQNIFSRKSNWSTYWCQPLLIKTSHRATAARKRSIKNNITYEVLPEMSLFVLRRTIRHLVELILRSYWFPKLRWFVQKHIKHCLKCITFNPDTGIPMGELHIIPKEQIPFDTLHYDHIDSLQTHFRHN